MFDDTILRGFEFVSGLNANLFKSNLSGVNIEDTFMLATATFLCCEIGKFLANFLGIPVGSNHRTQAVWKSVIIKMKNMLSAWKGRFLSIGGRVTLINAVLNTIPIYFLSFFKIPKVVLKEIIRIQREFLWCGGIYKWGIPWVSWPEVCRSKEEGGLGIKCIEAFNEFLLCKLRW
ncbi:unnamed protein product [Vicia faba]|uniref:Uncharacterized protein n=1 Tax=Vicia faba TaxID=3906 RepID=A0AAV1AEQ5_VICFA|nr:unnamed protein product [Vicia faba]